LKRNFAANMPRFSRMRQNRLVSGHTARAKRSILACHIDHPQSSRDADDDVPSYTVSAMEFTDEKAAHYWQSQLGRNDFT
jgi:hypothetical protein